jgi:hypothetical protein
MKKTASLWPAEQLLVTADTSEAVDAVLHPTQQLRFLKELSELVGPHLFADSLVYSTPDNNTGWTAFRMGPNGHIAFHHWDQGIPDLLQLDVLSAGSLDIPHALELFRSFWLPIGQRVYIVRREHPEEPLHVEELTNDLQKRTGFQHGLGPGDHLHLLVDQIGPSTGSATEPGLNSSLVDLVSRLRMRCMTPVFSRHLAHQTSSEYDGIVGITTSHLALRARENDGQLAVSLDVFSCRDFRPAIVLSWLDSLFPTPAHRRAVLYNRYPRGCFTTL